MTGPVELTKEEQELAGQIIFDASKLADLSDYEKAIANGELAAELFGSVKKRDAIPLQRWHYFTDPKYNPSNAKASKAELFLRNAHSVEAVLRHPHFLKYLSYFVYGPALPQDVAAVFVAVAKDSFREWNALSKLAAKSVPKVLAAGGVKDYDLDESFYQLALDCSCNLTEAAQVRTAVKRAVGRHR